MLIFEEKKYILFIGLATLLVAIISRYGGAAGPRADDSHAGKTARLRSIFKIDRRTDFDGADATASGKKISSDETVAEAAGAQKKYSRLTFFLSSPAAGSIAVPAEWEGKYETRETGNEFILVCSSCQEKNTEIFSVQWFSRSDWRKFSGSDAQNFELLKQDGQRVYAAKINPVFKRSDFESSTEKMFASDLPAVISSFKSYLIK